MDHGAPSKPGMANNRSDWYQLFSRGARDWLRHNEKVGEAVRAWLPDFAEGPDPMTGAQPATVHVPLPLPEHARFRLSGGPGAGGAGQGRAQAGDILRPADTGETGTGGTGGSGGSGGQQGESSLLLEFPMDDILEWLWDELHLPQLQPRGAATLAQPEVQREGWDRHGARTRLDRRRTVKQALRRRAIQTLQGGAAPATFTNDDLRFRQLKRQPRPDASAVVFFVLDVSASMTQSERRLAKTFFYFALQGLRRRYPRIAIRFLAHTAQAWEFAETEFFQVSGGGGTLASSAFRLVHSLLCEQYAAGDCNSYLFYASDGDNFTEDRSAAGAALGKLARMLNYLGYVETMPGLPRALSTEMRRLWQELERDGLPAANCVLAGDADIWRAIRQFFGDPSVLGTPA